MADQWLIDGCNFLHEARGVSAGGDARQIDRIASFAASQKVSVLFVMDGVGPSGEYDPRKGRYFEVIRSGKVSADTWIERHVSSHPDKLRLVIVSGDGAVRRAVRGSGARVLSPAEFRQVLAEEAAGGERIQFQERVRAHGFHRPLDRKLKEKGL